MVVEEQVLLNRHFSQQEVLAVVELLEQIHQVGMVVLELLIPAVVGVVVLLAVVHLLGADAIVAKLHELTGYMHDARDVARGMQELGEQAQAMQGGSARSGCMKRSCLLSGSIVRVLPGEVSALEYQTSRAGRGVSSR